MFSDPNLFDIEQKKLFGLYPHDQMLSVAMNPYLKRIKHSTIAMLVVGDSLGENIVDFLDSNPKIVKLNYVNEKTGEEISTVFQKNIKPYLGKLQVGIEKGKERDVVCIGESSCTAEALALYYPFVKHGGIFCGNGHEKTEVKEALTAFRRNSKIGTPIQVCHRTTWFWYVRKNK